MLKNILCFIFFSTFSFSAFAFAELYVSMPFGNSEFKENATLGSIDHLSLFDFGLNAGTRLRAEIGSVKVGGVAEIGWQGHSLESKTLLDSGSYRIERQRVLAGPSIGIGILTSGLRIEGEYYLHYSAKISYSDDKAANPFRKGDSQSGNGWAAGLSYELSSFVVTALYRQLEVTKSEFSGAALNSTYQNFKTTELAGTVGFQF